MKRNLVTFVVGALMWAPVACHAQSYDKAHQIAASEDKRHWPTFPGDDKPSDIKALQYLLHNRGFYKAPIDGVFGAKTQGAVRNFQRAKGLKADGLVGPQTWPLLLLRLKKGDRGDAVRAWQISLRDYGSPDGSQPFGDQIVDGIFGSSTRANVIKFQKYWVGLKVDGIVGAQTWEAILQPDLS